MLEDQINYINYSTNFLLHKIMSVHILKHSFNLASLDTQINIMVKEDANQRIFSQAFMTFLFETLYML